MQRSRKSSEIITAAQKDVSQLITNWDDALAQRIAARRGDGQGDCRGRAAVERMERESFRGAYAGGFGPSQIETTNGSHAFVGSLQTGRDHRWRWQP